jgi:hypothetical protein
MADPYVDLNAGAASVANTLHGAVSVNPDAAAEQRKLAAEIGVPPPTQPENQTFVKNQAAVKSMDLTDLLTNAPKTTQWIADPANAQIAHDDTWPLRGLEQSFQAAPTVPGIGMVGDKLANLLATLTGGKPGDIQAKSKAGLLSSVAGAMGLAGEVPDAIVRTLNRYNDWAVGGPAAPGTNFAAQVAPLAAPLKADAAQATKQVSKETWATGTAGLISGLVPAIGAGLIPGVGPAAVASIFAGQGADQMADAARAKGVYGTPKADAAILGNSAFQAALGTFGAEGKVADALPTLKNTVLDFLFKGGAKAATGAATGAAMSVGANAIEAAAIDPQKNLLDGVSENAGTMAALAAVFHGIHGHAEMSARADQSQIDGARLDSIDASAAASKLRERSPADFRAFVEHAAEGGPVSDVYVKPDIFAQAVEEASQKDPEALTRILNIPGITDKINEAHANGQDLRIPVEDFATAIAGTDLYAQLADHLKTDPEGMTRDEAKQYIQSDQAETLRADMEKAFNEHAGDALFNESADRVRQQLLDQLNEAGRFSPDVNAKYADLASKLLAVQAANHGLTPEEMHAQFPLSVRADEGLGRGFEQQAHWDTPEFKDWFGDSKVVDENGKPLVVYKGMYPHDWTQETVSDPGPLIDSIDRKSDFPAFNNGEPGVKIAGFFGDKDTANRFSKITDQGAVYPSYLSFQKPFVIDAGGRKAGDVQFGKAGTPFRDAIRSSDYDGVIIKNTADEGTVYVALKPEQIKSAIGNDGSYGRDNSNLLRQDAVFNQADEHLAAQGRAPLPEAATDALKQSLEAEGARDIQPVQVDQLVDLDTIPVLTMKDLVGMTIFPTIADRTAAAAVFKGIDSTETSIHIPLLGGPLFPLRESNVANDVVWANRGKGVTTQKGKKVEGGARHMMVVMGDADMHQSNTTVNNAFFATLDAYARDGRISGEGAAQLEDLVRSSTSEDASVDTAMKRFPGFADAKALDAYVHEISFEARKRLMGLLATKKAQGLGAPSFTWVLDATREPSMAGHRWGDGVLLVEIDPNNTMVNLGENGTLPHPDFPLGIRGKVVGRMETPVNYETLWQDWLGQAHQNAVERGTDPAKINTRRAFELGKPSVEVTQELADRIGDISAPNIDGARQAKLASAFAADTWRTSDEAKNKGGISPQEFIDAIHDSAASPVLSDYTPAEVKGGIKDGKLRLFQLGEDGKIFFALKKGDPGYASDYGIDIPEIGEDEVTLTSVLNNEQGARGIAAPAVVLKALKEGATVLDAFAVKNEKFADGFLPALYDAFGFEKVAEVPFDPSYYSDQKLADAVKYWKESTPGYDPETHGYPPLVIMKWRGTDADRSNIIERYLRSGVEGLLEGRIEADVRALSAELAASDQPSAEGGQAPADARGAAGDQGAGPGASVASRARRTVQGIANLSDEALKNLGLTPEDRSGVRRALGLPDDVFNQGPRGTYEPSTSTVRLSLNADLSTALHEFGHFSLDMLGDLADRPTAPEQTKQDMGTLLKWFGVPDLATWRGMSVDEQRPFHEQFAKGFETYLFEGKAPSADLKAIFQRFRAWLVSVYKSAKAIGSPINDDVRGVMDRLVATSAEIKAAEGANNYAPLFDTRPEGMTEDQWAEYHAASASATGEAQSELDTKSLRNMQWLDNAKGRMLRKLQAQHNEARRAVRDEVTKEVMAEPVNRARQFLKRGIGLDGKPVEGNHRLSLPELRRMYDPKNEGEFPVVDYEKLGYGKYGMLSEEGAHPDMLAEQLGYPSGEEMIQDLLTAEPARDKINGMTDQRMLERHGELVDPESRARAADEAVHNEFRLKTLRIEYDALAKATGKPRILDEAAKAYAADIIARQRVGDLKPAVYTAAEKRAAKAAVEAHKAGDLETAAEQKRHQLINGYAAKAAFEAQAEVTKGLAYLKKFDNAGTRKRIGTAIELIDNVLDAYDLRKVPAETKAIRKEALNEWYESQRNTGFEPLIDPRLLAADPGVHYKDVPLEQFRGLIDSVKSIEYVAREANSVMKDGKKIELDEAAGQLVERLAARGFKYTDQELMYPPEKDHDPLLDVALYRMQSWLRLAGQDLLPIDYKANKYDLHEIHGPFQELIFNRIFDRNYWKADTLKGISDDFKAAHEALGKDWQKSLRDEVPNPELIDQELTSRTGAPAMMRITRAKMLGIARHVGNESNFHKLTKGMGWEPDAVWRFLDANMTEKDWAATKATWDAFEKLWPETEAMIRRLGGVVPEKIPLRPFKTRFGEMAGGYAPIDYDPINSRLGAKFGEVMSDPNQSIGKGEYYKATTTRNSSLNNRVEGYTDRLNLNYEYIGRALKETVHDLAYREALLDADKLINHPDVRNAFQRAFGREEYAGLQKFLDNVKNMHTRLDQMDRVEKAFQYARQGVTAVGIGYRVSTVLKHGSAAALKSLGYMQGGGEKYFVSRLARIGTGQMAADIAEAQAKFPEIRTRMLQMDRDYKVASSGLFEGETLLEKNDRYGHAMVAWADALSAVATAHAAYDWATTEGIPEGLGGTGEPMSHDDAVRYANKVVREAHGSALETARSNFMHSKGVKSLFGVIYGFQNNTFGQFSDLIDKAVTGKGDKVNILAKAMGAIVVPAVFTYYLSHGGPQEADELPAWLAKAITGEAASMVPFVREAWAALEPTLEGKRFDANSLLKIPATQLIGNTMAVPIDLYHEAQGQHTRIIQHLADAVGQNFHISGMGQLGHAIQYERDVADGKQAPKDAAEHIRGATLGPPRIQ